MHPATELIALEGRCPECKDDNLTFISYEIDNEVVFNCETCGNSETISLIDLKEFGFYPENFDKQEIIHYVPQGYNGEASLTSACGQQVNPYQASMLFTNCPDCKTIWLNKLKPVYK